MPATNSRRVGLWLVGAAGGVGTTITLGLAALSRGLIPPTSLVTALPMFEGLDLLEPAEIVVGGHEIRDSTFEQSAEEFRASSGVFDASLLDACRPDLEAASTRLRTGTAQGAGSAIARLATRSDLHPDETPGAAVKRLTHDLEAFAEAANLEQVIVLNVSSTEPPFDTKGIPADPAELAQSLASASAGFLPASTLYALAALSRGFSYINFTPSLGASLPVLAALAAQTGAVLAGKDGKTGETLMKTVLAPMFVARNLEVMSWVGHNIFGNRDGVVLDDPANKSSKVATKDQVVSGILGYKPSSLVTIEYVPDMGDWKTAWDHIHFRGFLGCKMSLQFTWQGCDSLLAAPLAIDLARLVHLHRRHGGKGHTPHLACFFKNPEPAADHDFFRQFAALEAYARALKS